MSPPSSSTLCCYYYHDWRIARAMCRMRHLCLWGPPPPCRVPEREWRKLSWTWADSPWSSLWKDWISSLISFSSILSYYYLPLRIFSIIPLLPFFFFPFYLFFFSPKIRFFFFKNVFLIIHSERNKNKRLYAFKQWKEALVHLSYPTLCRSLYFLGCFWKYKSYFVWANNPLFPLITIIT